MKYFHKVGPASAGIAFAGGHHCAALVVGLLFTVLGQVEATNRYAASPSLIDVTAAVASAVDGDTVIVPAGTASWTSGITVTKSITIQGQTTVDSSAGTANDQTIILDDETTNNIAAIAMYPIPGKTVIVSGITFKPGSRTTTLNGGIVNIGGTTQSTAVRLHHCHFFGLYRNNEIYVSAAVYGVIDHNVFTYISGGPLNCQTMLVRNPNWNGDLNGVGDGSWADYPWFGTEKFIFFEDNYSSNATTNQLNGTTDADFGARFVIRHNHWYNVQVQNHGTEHRYRGTRAAEIYNNDLNFSASWTALGGVRTGTYLYHDNTFSGLPGNGLGLSYLRYTFNFDPTNATTFHGASGAEPWDVNVTEADGTHVDGHSPYLFASGTCASGSSQSTIVDNTKSWNPHQWIGYTVQRVSGGGIDVISENTATTLTLLFASGGYGSGPVWASGDQYQIHKVLIALDQPGHGKGDLITGGYNNPPPTLDRVTGTAAWPHQALEPCYAWNNLYNGATEYDFYVPTRILPTGQTILQNGRDYYNASSSAAVVAKYTASLNGVDYTGPYTYPHPLVSGVPAAPQGLHVAP